MSFTAAATTFLSLLSFIKFTGPDNFEKKEWKRHDQVLKVRLAQLHNDIAHAPVDNIAYIEALVDTLTSEIRQFFLENIEFFESDSSSSSSNKFIAHKNSTISQSRHSGPLGPISLQWQKCQLTLLFSRQPDSNRELRKQAPR